MDKEEYLRDEIRDLEDSLKIAKQRNARLSQNLGPVDQLELDDIHNVQEDEEEDEDEENDENGDHVFNFDSDTDINSEDSEESFAHFFGSDSENE